ncbi:chaplin [Streptomyces sp. NPDC059477]|uniref:chaplin n=1 Tax=Streptomyces sp. NPDC059477 TaxID=3346847 RepID=UPI0036CEBEA9
MSRIAKAAGVALGAGAVVLGGTGMAMADAGAGGAAVGSPGVLSGNLIQVPVHVPVNVCGNTINVVGLLNPAFGNTCANVSDHGHRGGGYGGGYGR